MLVNIPLAIHMWYLLYVNSMLNASFPGFVVFSTWPVERVKEWRMLTLLKSFG